MLDSRSALQEYAFFTRPDTALAALEKSGIDLFDFAVGDSDRLNKVIRQSGDSENRLAFKPAPVWTPPSRATSFISAARMRAGLWILRYCLTRSE